MFRIGIKKNKKKSRKSCKLNKGIVRFATRFQKRNGNIEIRGSSSVGRARPCQGRGRGFESRLSLERNDLGERRDYFF